MAYISDYRDGTVALTAGTKALVGSGTAWSLVGIQTGDMFMQGGFIGIIETIVDNTHITLRDNWGGPTLAAGSTYSIKYSPDQSRVQASVVALIERLSGAIFTELGALDISTADRLLYTDAANSLGLAPLTAFARTLLDDTSASAAQTTLGYTAADVLTKLLSVNGAASVYAPPNNDEFAGYPTGVSYSHVLGITGFPAGIGTVITVKINSNRTFQFGLSAPGAVASVRTYHASNPNWSAWSTMYGTSNVNGAVTGTYSAPTGGLMETGSNANGTYWRFANRLQICSHTFALDAAGIGSWTFPVAFPSTPRVFCTPLATNGRVAHPAGLTATTATSVDINGFIATTGTGSAFTLTVAAIGTF